MSTPSPTPGRERYLPRLVIAICGWLALFPLTSVDVYYHLAVGRRIVEQGSIPSRGFGSATFGDAEWHDQEWGFQVVAAKLGLSGRDELGLLRLTPTGIGLLILLRALALMATLALLSAQMALLGVDAISRAVGVLLAAFLTFGNLFWAVRPQIFSYLALAATLYLLERDRRGRPAAGWATLGVVALWANLHGAFVIGIAVLGAEALGAWLDRADRARAWHLTSIAAAAPFAALLNPHGYRQLIHPFMYILEPQIYRGNAEWSRPDFLHLPLLVLTLSVLAVSLMAARRFRGAELLRIGMFLLLLAGAIRHLPLAVLVVVPPTFAALACCATGAGWRRRLLPTAPPRSRPSRLIAAGVLAIVIVSLSGAKLIGPLPRIREQPLRPMPEQALRRLSAAGAPGNGFNAYRFGGLLMYRLYPREVVFMDGRNDLYREFRDRVYNPILSAGPGWQALWEQSVRRFDLRWALLDESDPLLAGLRDDPRWSVGPALDGTPGVDGVVLCVRKPEEP